MTKHIKKTKKEFEIWATKIAKVYMERFGLSLMEVEFNNNNDVEYLEVYNIYPYQDIIRIKYSDNVYSDWVDNKEKVKYPIIHEVLHILISPLHNKAMRRFVSEEEITDELEILTDKLMTIIKAYDKLII